MAIAVQKAYKLGAFTVDEETDAAFREIANRDFDGNLTAAFTGLVRAVAGEELPTLGLPKKPLPEYDTAHWNPQRLSWPLVQELARIVFDGNPLDVALESLGVDRKQSEAWLAEGRRHMAQGKASIYADLVHATTKARADSVRADIEQARRNGRSATEIFKRLAILYPERYADRKSTRLNSSHIQKSRMPSSA